MMESQEPQPPLEGGEVKPAPEGHQPAPDPYPFWGYLDVLLLVSLAVPMMFLAVGIVSGILYLIRWAPLAKAVSPIAAMFLFYGLWFLLLYELIRIRYGRPFWYSLRWIHSPRRIGDCVLWGFIVAMLSIMLAAVLRPPPIKTPLDELLQDPVSIALVGVFAVTLGPVFEELAFRGFLQPLLVRTFGAVAGVLLQALPFALLHGVEYAWSWQRLLPIFVAGAAFGWMRHTSGSTASAAYMHSGYNAAIFLAGTIAQRFNP
jgi:membrane protease YdiL (CAAX protease family)